VGNYNQYHCGKDGNLEGEKPVIFYNFTFVVTYYLYCSSFLLIAANDMTKKT